MSAASLKPGPALFSCRAIGHAFGSREVLKNISLAAQAGEVLGVVGPNGAGKTTLFEILSGRLRPSRGQVFLGETELTRLPLHARARLGIGRTYQSPVVPEHLSLGEVFRAARQAYRPFLSAHDAEWAAHQVGLAWRPAALAGSLGALDRRRLLLACLLMRKPKVLLMDEPAAGLINAEIDAIDGILRYVAQELQVAVLLVEHRLELLAALAGRVVVLDGGELIADGLPEQVFQEPRVRAAYFEAEAA
ncbi:branched-chain amino acid ABC transporter ATP-binding protein [Paucibacter sp. KBW04]|uniref:ATP-binding cassette domain-containing protein n=1 Tax=Paucibacter sp. KBW04 TaxID=2153361 RepID=UPI000F570E9C|nr:ATP-binding cassette domain-containing protein [Paucibacter sp. KBW04]RQO63530.1 branched-chain amino acid ABC transporter ATP-binding protein [Paucibacter sp. KBW04]